MTSNLLGTLVVASLLLGGSATAATLTVTPDKSTCLVGETITLSVFGDAEGADDNGIFGRLVFDGGLAEYGDSSQDRLTSLGGLVPWFTFELIGGDGFAEAFSQGLGGGSYAPDGPLSAEVVLRAVAPGTLAYNWLADRSGFNLDFFGLIDAPGGSVTIVPEPSTLLLVGLGLLLLRRVGRPH